MVKQISATIKVEVTESDDAKHRYVLYKEWDKDKPTCTIITLFPGSAELVITDKNVNVDHESFVPIRIWGILPVNLF